MTDKLNEWTLFSEKYKELCEWLTNMESKVSQNGDISIEEMIEKLRKVKEMQVKTRFSSPIMYLLFVQYLASVSKCSVVFQPVIHLSFIRFASVNSFSSDIGGCGYVGTKVVEFSCTQFFYTMWHQCVFLLKHIKEAWLDITVSRSKLYISFLFLMYSLITVRFMAILLTTAKSFYSSQAFNLVLKQTIQI